MCEPVTQTQIQSPLELFGNLPVVKIRFRIVLSPSAKLPFYTGSGWRGLLGVEIQKLVCPFHRRPVCNFCAIREHCPAFLLMEKKSPGPGLLDSPRGYVIFPPPPENPTRPEVFVTLAGDCVRFLPVLVQAMINGGKTGIGRERHPYKIASVHEVLPHDGNRMAAECTDAGSDIQADIRGPFPLSEWIGPCEAPPETLNLRWATPLRLRRKGKYLDRMDWDFYFAALVRRLEALDCLYSSGAPLGKDGWRGLQPHLPSKERFSGRFRWWDYQRYSNRQKRKVPMGGLVGEAVMTAPTASDLQWWKAAELLHTGKGASMGLGKVEIF